MDNPTPETTPPAPPESSTKDRAVGFVNDIFAAVGGVLMALLGLLMPVAVVAFLCACGWATYSLGMLFKMDWLYAAFLGVGSVLLLMAHAGQIVNSQSNAQRMLNGMGLLVWIILLLFFAACFFGATSAGVTSTMTEAQITETLGKSFLPPDVLDGGRTLLAYAPAIGLATAMVAAVVSYVTKHPLIDGRHKTLGESFAPMALVLVTGLVVAGSGIHVYGYGVDYAGMQTFEALTVCIVAELTFISAEQMAVKEIKARAEVGNYDLADLIAWGVLALAALTYMLLINHVYNEMSVLIVGGMSKEAAHMATNTGIFKLAKDLYGVSAPVFGGLLVVMKIITTIVNVNAGKPVSTKESRPTVSIWTRLRNALTSPTPSTTFNQEKPEQIPERTGDNPK